MAAIPTPSFFDQFDRIRTPAEPFDPNTDYSDSIAQLTEACLEFNYVAAAPQNLMQPAHLHPVIVLRRGKKIHALVNPKIVSASGSRPQIDGCGNIFLYHNAERVHVEVLVERPTSITVSYIDQEGNEAVETFNDRYKPKSLNRSISGLVLHEIEHLMGILIADYAFQRFLRVGCAISEALDEDEKYRQLLELPHILVREENAYVLRHGVEFHKNIPSLSPDALYLDRIVMGIDDTNVSVHREGLEIPVVISDFVKKMQKAKRSG